MIQPYRDQNSANGSQNQGSCCDGTNLGGGIGVVVNTLDFITNCVTDLNANQLDFISKSRFSLKIRNYLEKNGCNEQTSAFTKLAINALDNNGEVDWEEQVILDATFVNMPCLKSVYDQMGKATKFKEYLQNFEASFSVANLRLTADDDFGTNEGDDYMNAMAITKPPLLNNIINVKFNTDTNTTGNILNKPDVFKAVSMIHEMIHADMYRKMLDAVKAAEINQTNLQWDTWPNNTDFEDFIESLQNRYFGIFDFYTRFEWDTATPSSAQHQLMANNYRNIVKQALTDYDSTLTDTQKEALSWIGLNEANVVAWQNYPNKNTVTATLINIKNTFSNGCN